MSILAVTATAAHAETLTYTYDARGQMTSSATSGGATVTYTYDANGNRTQKAVTGGTAGSNTAPVAEGDLENAESYYSNVYPMVSFNPLLNDTDANGDTLTVTAVTQPWSGTVTFSGNWVTYTHNRKYPADGMADIGDSDEFTYTISDGHGGTAVGSVMINIVVW